MVFKKAGWSLLVGVLLTCFSASAQEEATDSVLIMVKGTVVDRSNPNAWMNIMVVNSSSGQGNFGDGEGHFMIAAYKKDTILVGSLGYATQKLCFQDSVLRSVYKVNLNMKRLNKTLADVKIFPQRDLDEIYRDIDQLGYDKRDYTMYGVDAINSPITALYMAFSKREQSRREVARLENEDRRRDLLKELLRQYADANIVQLSDGEFERFIDYCGVTDRFMQTSSQYEFIQYIKSRFSNYSIQNDYFFDPNQK